MKTKNNNNFIGVSEQMAEDMAAIQAAMTAYDQEPGRLDDQAASSLSYIFDLAGHSLSTPGFQAVTACEGEAGMVTDLNQLMASVYNAPYARFSSGGSSLAILCLLAAVLPKITGTRKIILVDEDAHQSVTGGLIFGGWKVVRIPRPYYAKYGIHGPVLDTGVTNLIQNLGAENIAAILYNAPGYNGFRNLEAERSIYQICNGKGILVITDSAWGSTYGLGKNDQHSLMDNADIVITSPHKRGLTPNSIASVLFRNSSHADLFSAAGRLGFSSTSPSYILLAIAQYRLSKVQAGQLENAFVQIKTLSTELRSRITEIHPKICVASSVDISADYHDPAHLLICTAGAKDVDARNWASILSTYFNLDVEKSSRNTLLLLLSAQYYQQADQILSILKNALNNSSQANLGAKSNG